MPSAITSRGGGSRLLKDLSFSKLLAHTFPGFVLVLGVVLILDRFLDTSIVYTVYSDFENLTAFAAALILTGTIAGIVIDTVQHSDWFSGTISKISNRKEPSTKAGPSGSGDNPARESYNKLIEHLDSKVPEGARLEDLKIETPYCFYGIPFINFDVYRHLLNEYYYYSEFYINLALAMPFFALGSLSFIGHRVVDIGDGMLFYPIAILLMILMFAISWALILLGRSTKTEFWEHYVELMAGTLAFKYSFPEVTGSKGRFGT